MIKIEILNEIKNKSYGAKFITQEEAHKWRDEQIAKDSWGKPERYIKTEELSEELQGRVISTRIVEVEEGENYEESLVKADYVITETDLSKDKEYRNQQKIEARKKEYPSMEEVLHIILDHGADSPEFEALQNKRREVKEKNKLEK